MDSLHGILHGLSVAITPTHLLYTLIGTFIGTMISHLPGIGPSAGSPLAAWHKRLCARPSVAATFKEFEGATQGMANAADRLASGAIRREYRDHRLEWMMKSGGVQVVCPAGVASGYISLVSGLAVAVGVVESAMARYRLTRVPQFIVGAATLSVVAFIVLLV